jgi:hypothetical protein
MVTLTYRNDEDHIVNYTKNVSPGTVSEIIQLMDEGEE